MSNAKSAVTMMMNIERIAPGDVFTASWPLMLNCGTMTPYLSQFLIKFGSIC